MSRADSDDYRRLFVDDLPLLDVRAPVEFARGAFPAAVNIPLLDDAQREQIGIRYKHAGQDEAIRLGLELATPEIRAERLARWSAFCARHPDGYLYCFRGGLRSRTTQQWLRNHGIDYPLVVGGYKAMRRFLIDELEYSLREVPLVCVGGLTGVGKTRVLLETPHHIDFEGLANHRGSAFGRDPLNRQPSPIDWENAVSIAFLKHRARYGRRPLLVEDEGRNIGRINMPEVLVDALARAPRAILVCDRETRIRQIREDYIERAWPGYVEAWGEAAAREFSRFVLDNLTRIRKRLGGERYREVYALFEGALDAFFATGGAADFDTGIGILLDHYYDPMYRYQIRTKRPKIVFEGTEAELLEWAREYCSG